MIKTLNAEELEKYIVDAKLDAIHSIVLHLSTPTVDYWKDSKKFALIKKELSVYNNVKFGCKQTTNGCTYFFFTKNKYAKERIIRFFAYIADHKRSIHLMEVPKDYENTWTMYGMPPEGGSYNACPLFN